SVLLPRLSLFSSHITLHTPPPHSFPTRRSSDLADLRLVAHPADRQPHELAPESTRDRLAERGLADAGRPDEAQDLSGDLVAELRDRKSTRLNSSHQIISYAVFCLKKKEICITL